MSKSHLFVFLLKRACATFAIIDVSFRIKLFSAEDMLMAFCYFFVNTTPHRHS